MFALVNAQKLYDKNCLMLAILYVLVNRILAKLGASLVTGGDIFISSTIFFYFSRSCGTALKYFKRYIYYTEIFLEIAHKISSDCTCNAYACTFPPSSRKKEKRKERRENEIQHINTCFCSYFSPLCCYKQIV